LPWSHLEFQSPEPEFRIKSPKILTPWFISPIAMDVSWNPHMGARDCAAAGDLPGPGGPGSRAPSLR
jgi:hypothetical protein